MRRAFHGPRRPKSAVLGSAIVPLVLVATFSAALVLAETQIQRTNDNAAAVERVRRIAVDASSLCVDQQYQRALLAAAWQSVRMIVEPQRTAKHVALTPPSVRHAWSV